MVQNGVKCPFCFESLGMPMPPVVEKEYSEHLAKEAAFLKKEEARIKKITKPRHRSDTIPRRRVVDLMAQNAFCKLHKVELEVRPKGIKAGYPSTIDFVSLPKRIQNHVQDMEGIIDGTVYSTFKACELQFYQENTANFARSTLGRFARFDLASVSCHT